MIFDAIEGGEDLSFSFFPSFEGKGIGGKNRRKNIEIIRSNEITGPFDPRAPKIRQDPD